jgi:HK97 family phage major capsid protein
MEDIKMSLEELKKLHEEQGRVWEEYKATNDKRLLALESKGAVPADLDEKLGKLEARMTEISKAERRIEAVENAVARGNFGGGGGTAMSPAKAEHAKAFNAWMRKGVEAGLKDLEIKAELSTLSDPDGGYMVPDAIPSAMITVAQAMSVMRSICSVQTIGGAEWKELVDVGGESAEWVGEKDTRSETDTAQLKEVTIVPAELSAKPKVTQTLLDDASYDVEGWIGRFIGRAFSAKEGAGFISGNGVKQPKGIAAYTMIANASYAWGKVGYIHSGHASLLNNADKLIDLQHALKVAYRANARWLMNDLTLSVVRKFKDGEGNYLFVPGLVAGAADLLLGKPIAYDDYVDDIGAGKYPIFFGDFREGYLIVDRVGIRMLRDPYSSKPYVEFYTTKRVGGGIRNYEAIKAMKIHTS